MQNPIRAIVDSYTRIGKHLRRAALFGACALLTQAASVCAQELVPQPESQRFTLHIRELGRLEVRLSPLAQRKAFNPMLVSPRGGLRQGQNEFFFNTGSLRLRRISGAQLISAHLSRDLKRGRSLLSFKVRYNKRSKHREVEYLLLLQEDAAHLSIVRQQRVPVHAAAMRCSQDAESSTHAQVPLARNLSAPLRAAGGNLLYGLAIDVDSSFNRRFGADTELVVATLLQRVQAIYSSQLGLDLRLVRTRIFTSSSEDPYASQSLQSLALLASVGSQREEQVGDSLHLLTSARGFLDAIGYAEVGVVCANPGYSYGWSDYSNGFGQFVVTVAHELAHNLSATHDTTERKSIMWVRTLSDDQNPFFAQANKNQVASFIESYGTCLLNTDDPALPTPASALPEYADESASNVLLSFKLKRSASALRVMGTLKLVSGQALAEHAVTLLSFPKQRSVRAQRTASDGSFSFTIRKRGRYYLGDRLSGRTSRLFRF